MSQTLPTIRLNQGHARRLRGGHPWAFSNEITMDQAALALPPGSLVKLETEGGALGIATFNPHSLIAARLLTRDLAQRIDEDFLAARLAAAERLRDRLIGAPYYRLIHAEADGLPGFVIDRFGPTVTVQVNTAGAELLLPRLLAALAATIRPATVVVRADAPVRTLEGLSPRVEIVHGALDGPVEVREGKLLALADPLAGQKTGWFYDQRDNRAFVAALADGATVLDLYCYSGAFALACAAAGATQVEAVDSSEAALELATQAAERAGLAERITFAKGDAFGALERAQSDKRRYGVVIADPPAFVKAKKDLAVGLRGYRKLARLAAARVAPGGFLCLASCSHHVAAADYADAVRQGLVAAGRSGRILRAAGAGPDHPIHPALPESAYLKSLTLQLD